VSIYSKTSNFKKNKGNTYKSVLKYLLKSEAKTDNSNITGHFIIEIYSTNKRSATAAIQKDKVA